LAVSRRKVNGYRWNRLERGAAIGPRKRGFK
jgi:hypothetical protein